MMMVMVMVVSEIQKLDNGANLLVLFFSSFGQTTQKTLPVPVLSAQAHVGPVLPALSIALCVKQ